MLPPTKIDVPKGTKAIYITAISLCTSTSTASVSWSDSSSATFGADFKGPNKHYVLGDSVFGLPVVAINDNVQVPSELSISFDFNDTIQSQHHVTGPTTKKVGPEGDATEVQMSGFAADDKENKFPTTVTILFQGSLGGIKYKK